MLPYRQVSIPSYTLSGIPSPEQQQQQHQPQAMQMLGQPVVYYVVPSTPTSYEYHSAHAQSPTPTLSSTTGVSYFASAPPPIQSQQQQQQGFVSSSWILSPAQAIPPTPPTPQPHLQAQPQQQQQMLSFTVLNSSNVQHPPPQQQQRHQLPQLSPMGLLQNQASTTVFQVAAPSPPQQQLQHQEQHLVLSPPLHQQHQYSSFIRENVPVRVIQEVGGQHLAQDDADDLEFARETAFRFKMIPPPLPFEKFIEQWKVNAFTDDDSEAGSYALSCARHDAERMHEAATAAAAAAGRNRSPAVMSLSKTIMGLPFSQSTPQMAEFTAAAPGVPMGQAATFIEPGDNGNNNANNTPSTDATSLVGVGDIDLILCKYRAILQRWFDHISIIEKKPEVQSRLRLRRGCPSIEEVESKLKEEFPGSQLSLRKVMEHWSRACLAWWQETNRKRAHRGKRSSARNRLIADHTTTSPSFFGAGGDQPRQRRKR